ncbi:MAG TPA: phosphate ABC transporter substrate-binding protein PstS [Candidatus Nanopelagicales bacterium]
MKLNRVTALTALAVTGALALSGCASDASSTATQTSTISGQTCQSGTLKASGSTAQANAMASWIKSYQSACSNATIDYQATGSGAGVTDFINKQTAFAGSDSALSGTDKTNADARCATGPAIDIPMVGGAIAVAYNVSGLTKLVLTPKLVAEIFSGQITKWNDPQIVAANPGATLPSATIAQLHRSEASGTTDNFTKYLTATAPTVWTFKGGKSWTAPGGQGAKGSDGVGAALTSTPNSIGYIELSFALTNNLTTAWIDNGAGAVQATSANAAKTISTATIKGTGNDLALSIDYKTATPDAYPVVLVTYEIACQSGNDSSTLSLLKGFLTYTSGDSGQAQLSTSGYVPISGDLLTKVRSAVSSLS